MSYEGTKLAPARLPTTVPLTTAVNAFSNKVAFPTAVSNIVSTNLVINSDGAVGTYSSGGVTAATTALTGFTNSVQYGDNTAVRYAYKSTTFVTGVTYQFSAYVQMDDDSVPVPGAQTLGADFTIVMAGGIKSTASNVKVELVSGSLYRVSVAWVSTISGSGNSGLVKYTQNSAKPFRVAGYQVEVGSVVSDFITTGASTVTRNEFEVTGLLKASNGLTVSAGTISFPAASISDSALSSNVVLLTGSQTLSGAKTFSSIVTASAGLSVTGTATATTFSGSGASLTALNATNLNTGTVADARLSSNVALLTGVQTFTGNKTFSGTVTLAADPTSALQAATKQYVDSKVGSGTVTVVSSLASAYNATVNSILLVKLTAAATANIVFPAGAAAGDQIVVKDASGNFATYNVTLARSGTDTIEGDTSILLNLNRMSVVFVSDGSGGWWLI
jgi:hypothetical protein